MKRLAFLSILLLLLGGAPGSLAHPQEVHCKHCNQKKCEDYHDNTWNPGWKKCKEKSILGYKFCSVSEQCERAVEAI